MKRSSIVSLTVSIILTLLIPAANFYLFEFFISNPFENMKPQIQLLNIVFFELSALFLFFVFGRIKWALRFQSVFFMVIGLADYYVLSFRSAPIMPWDIYSAGTALSVADNFEYSLEKNTVFVLIGFAVLIILASMARLNIKNICGQAVRATAVRLVGILASAGFLAAYTHYVQLDSTVLRFGMYDKLFTPTVMSRRDGSAVAFLMELKYISIDTPDDYSADKAREILEPYAQNTDALSFKRRPNIIVVMNEAFSDLSVLGSFETNKDYMPFIHSLMQEGTENTVSGHLNVSVLGGNTANTEFEFLTGNSMAFLPQGSVPYQQYIKDEMPSLVSYLKSLGYQTAALHPYNSTGWDRNKVYPLLGFDSAYFIRSFVNPEKIRKYVSDRACYEKIISLYENRQDGAPLFIFNVTMQNHSSYTEEFDNFTPDITVADSNSKALNNYLSLIKLSDEEIRELIDYFSCEDEETVIVFFGDHQPTNSVVSNIWKINGKNGNNLSEEDEAKRYIVPFFIWANFDIAEESGVETSANFLGGRLLEICGLPLYDYAAYLKELSKSFPVITSIRAQSSDGESSDIKSVSDKLNDYAILQYNKMFD